MELTTYKTTDGIECVLWSDQYGFYSMYKSTYDAQLEDAQNGKLV